ncbi:hypothetical protein Amet_4346 [Alkaliphilus metalliredigens QYMF]|uniref:DUF2634 domain-containing protein n=2 Tax=Alkaliphilus TaxID=114627 RepID=A6TKE5_ALKMQ|nr:hypothetical protein Amet_0435 [Alkaliphilus metalliredigens QYMF]ABR48135.1 hypothetical protein Amet_1972 [Alkaliphilus metalliredigens QYMF]ABR50420.1 hypothetical protein Amet_4346 [Alkaliphilus metalliredigens QYMF]
MKTFKIVDDDIVFDGQNNIVMVEGKDEEIQSINRVFTTRLNEFFLEPEHGFDYSVLQTKQVDEEQIRLAVIEAANQDPRVQEVEELNIIVERKSRKVTIDFKVKMQSGELLEGQEVLDIA